MVTPNSLGTRILAATIAAALVVQFACEQGTPRPVSDADRKAITDSLEKLVTNAYDLTAPNPVSE